MRAFRILRWAVVGAQLSGCVVGPDYRSPGTADIGVPARYAALDVAPSGTSGTSPGSSADTLVGVGRSDPVARWWSVFGDPVLTGLIDRATADNLDVAQSLERLVQAEEALVQVRGASLPTLVATHTSGRNLNNQGTDFTSHAGQLQAAWTIDLFGALARSRQAAAADLAGAGFDVVDVRRVVASQVATSYVNYRASVVRLAIARDTLRTQDDNLEIAGFRAQAGLVSSLDVEQARTQQAQTAATIAPLQQAIASARNQVSILIGQAPGSVDAMLARDAPIPAGPAGVAVGIPADTLRQRPDVRASERAMAAASARIGVAQAQLYPGLTLTGNVGTSALTVGSLGDVITGGVFGSLSQTIFQGGQLRSRVRAQESAARGAFSAYKATVLTALQEIESGLVAITASRDRARVLAVAAEAADNAAVLARSQYRSGLTDFRTLLSVEQSLLLARDGLASARSAEATSLIQLYVALGGGWDAQADLSYPVR